MFLKGQGYAVRAASSGEEALQLLAQENAELILLDLSLPSMSGEDFIKELRTDPARAGIKILLTSGQDNLKQRVQDLAVDGYCLKPSSLDDLARTIQNLLT